MRKRKNKWLFWLFSMVLIWSQLSAGVLVTAETTQAPNIETDTSKVVDIAAGNHFTLAVKEDGSVWSWGSNNMGQLGINSTTDQFLPQKIEGLTDVIAVSAGGVNSELAGQASETGHALALKADGTVWAWGYNQYGQLGNGTTENKTVPVQVKHLTNVIAIASGSTHSLALKSDGTVWAWGNNASGQLGDGTTDQQNTPVQVNALTDVVKIFSGVESNSSFAIAEDGKVFAWGSNWGKLGTSSVIGDELEPMEVTAVQNVSAIASGSNHTIMVTSDGQGFAWGDNFSGRLGTGNEQNHDEPVVIENPLNLQSIASSYHSLGLTADGKVWGWGGNSFGAIGDGTTNSSYSPVQVPGLTNVKKITIGQNHSVALTADGEVFTWGLGFNGQLGYAVTQLFSTTPWMVTDYIIPTVPEEPQEPVQSEPVAADDVTITNNRDGISDWVVVKGLSEGDYVKVYRNSNYEGLIGTSGKIQIASVAAVVSVPQLGVEAGEVYITAVRNGKTESVPVRFDYAKEDAPTDREAVAATKGSLSIGLNQNTSLQNVTSDLALPVTGKYGTTITWESSNSALVAADGQVFRPDYIEGNKAVHLTATISKGAESDQRIFSLVVKSEDASDVEAVLTAKNKLNAGMLLNQNPSVQEVTEDLNFPTLGYENVGISWTSSHPEVIAADGKVHRPEAADATVTITAVLTKGSTSEQKSFTFTVKKENKSEETVKEVISTLTEDVIKGENPSLSELESKLNLITQGKNNTMIKWRSDNPSIIGTDGKVTRPVLEDTIVNLTATVTNGSYSEEIAFTVVVKTTNPIYHVSSLFAQENYAFTVKREYYQLIEVSLQNFKQVSQDVEIQVVGAPSDLTLDFTGAGSNGNATVLLPGEQENVQLAIAAQETTQKDYKLILQAVDPVTKELLDTANLALHIDFKEVNFSVNEINENTQDLSKTYRITNLGDTITDFFVLADSHLAKQITFKPGIDGVELQKGEHVDFTVSPNLNASFQSIQGTLTVSGSSMSKQIPIAFTIPENKQIYDISLDQLLEHEKEKASQKPSLENWQIISNEQTSPTDVHAVIEDPETKSQLRIDRKVTAVDRELTPEEKAGGIQYSYSFDENNNLVFQTTRYIPADSAVTGQSSGNDSVLGGFVKEEIQGQLIDGVFNRLTFPLNGKFNSQLGVLDKTLFNGTLWGLANDVENGTRDPEELYAYFGLQIITIAVDFLAPTNPGWMVAKFGLYALNEAFEKSIQDGNPIWYHLLEMMGIRCINRGRSDTEFAVNEVEDLSSANTLSSFAVNVNSAAVTSSDEKGHISTRITVPEFYGGNASYLPEDFTYYLNGVPVKSFPNSILRGPVSFDFDLDLLRAGKNSLTEINSNRNKRNLILRTDWTVMTPVPETKTFSVVASSETEAKAAAESIVGDDIVLGKPKFTVVSESITFSDGNVTAGESLTVKADIHNIGPVAGMVFAGIFQNDTLVKKYPLSIKAFSYNTIEATLDTSVMGDDIVRVVLMDLFEDSIENQIAQKTFNVKEGDQQGPVISNEFPIVTSEESILVGAEVQDASPIQAVTLTIDGSAVVGNFEQQGQRVWFRLEDTLDPGNHEVVLTVEDQFGNKSEKKWTMTVSEGTTVQPPTVKPIVTTDTTVQGTAQPNISIQVKNGDTVLGTTITDEAGNFSITIPAQPKDTTLLIVAIDDAGNISPITTITVMQDECFIATAAFGSKFEPNVTVLREFRDEFLLTNKAGKKFVEFYYTHSPVVADYIGEREGLKKVVRGLLAPGVLVAKALLKK